MQQATTLQLALCAALYLTGQRFVLVDAKGKERISHGEEVPLEDYPYVVNIWHGNDYIASGTIVSSKCIITAAHVLANVNLPALRIYGAVKRPTCSKAFEARAAQIITPAENIPPAYTRSRLSRRNARQFNQSEHTTTTTTTPSNKCCCVPALDVAVIVLNEPQCVQLSLIPIDQTPVQAGDRVTVAGWGYSDLFNDPNVRLTIFNSTVTPDFRCQFFWGSDRFADTRFCVEEQRLGVRPNKRDAGGPAIRNGKQVGIVSAVNTCTASPVPSVYTRLSSAAVKAFLRKTLEGHC